MSKITQGSKRTILITCLVIFAILLPITYLAIQQNSKLDNIGALQGEQSDGFNFQLNFNTLGRYQIDTYKGTFTKDLVMDGIKTIEFKIPDNVKKDIYNHMMDIDIMSFPDTLKVEGMGVKPSCDYKLTVTIKGKTKTIVWKEGLYPDMTTNLPNNNADFLKLVKYISDYIYSTDEYKNMPKANGGYL